MNIFKNIWQKLKNIFIKKDEVVMLNEGEVDSNQGEENFKESLKVTIERVRKKVETPICYGDGLGIKRKMQS